MIVPNNDDTRTIMYDQRFLLGDEKRYPPLAYKVSKVSPSMNREIIQFTMTQEQFSSSLDSFEHMVGGYYSSVINPEIPEQEEIPTVSDLEIVHSGKPSIKAGGGYKKFTLKTIVDGKLVDVADDVEWSIDDESKLTVSSEKNVVKIKCGNDYSLIGKTFTLTAKSRHNSKSITIEVVGI